MKKPPYIDIGHVRVYTSSMIKAARVAEKVTRTRQQGTIDGTLFECLAIARGREEKGD